MSTCVLKAENEFLEKRIAEIFSRVEESPLPALTSSDRLWVIEATLECAGKENKALHDLVEALCNKFNISSEQVVELWERC